MSEITKKQRDDSGKVVLFYLAPLVACGIITYSYPALWIYLCAALTSRACDIVTARMQSRPFDYNDRSSVVSALIFSMLLPATIPLYIVIVCVLIGTMLGKYAFGGEDHNIFNLSAFEMALAVVNWPQKVLMSVKPMSTDSVAVLSSKMGASRMAYSTVLDILVGNGYGTIGSSFLIVVIACGIYMIYSRTITWHIPASFLTVCTAFSLAMPRISGMSMIGSLRYELLYTPLIFYAVFMFYDVTTTPQNPKAKIVYGALAGILVMCFNYFGGYENGRCFAILLANVSRGALDRYFSGDKRIFADHSPEIWKKSGKKAKRASQAGNKKENQVQTEPDVYKANQSPEEKAKRAKRASLRKTVEIIAEAEDKIDEVEFSTRTLSVDEVKKALEQQEGKR